METGEEHCAEQLLAILRRIGIRTKNKELVLSFSRKNEMYINARLAENNFAAAEQIIAIHPSATSAAKSWTKEKFSRLADMLIKECKVKIVFTGSPHEKKYVAAITGLMQSSAIDVSGKTTVGQMTALYKRAGLFIGMDSGPTHVASAVGSKIIALFGPSRISAWRPWISMDRYVLLKKDLPCLGCCQGVCPLYEKPLCLESIEVEEVVSAVKKLS